MSAFMHSTAHVDAIIHGAIELTDAQYIYFGNPTQTLQNQPTQAGQLLMRENAESMAYRYNMKDLDNTADDGTRPIEYLGYLEQAEGYEYKPDTDARHKSYSVPEILVALHSLEYQSCEHPEFEASDAHKLIRAIERALIAKIPGYSGASTWAIYDEEVSA